MKLLSVIAEWNFGKMIISNTVEDRSLNCQVMYFTIFAAVFKVYYFRIKCELICLSSSLTMIKNFEPSAYIARNFG